MTETITKSDPPNTQAIRTKVDGVLAAIGLIIGALTDWAGIAAVCYLAPLQKWSVELTAATVVGLATGTIVSKARGKIGGSTAAAIMTVPMAKAVTALLSGGASRWLGSLALVLCLQLTACVPGAVPKAILSVIEVAAALCDIWAHEPENEPALGGLTPAAFCALPHVRQAYAQSADGAMQSAGALASMRAVPPGSDRAAP